MMALRPKAEVKGAGQALVSALFTTPKDLGPRIWGSEWLLHAEPKCFTFKRIVMHPGARGGLQKHWKKTEFGYVVSGRAIVKFDPGDKSLVDRIVGPGDQFLFRQGAVHQIIALDDEPFEYLEASTPYLNDRIHVEHEYGIEAEAGGLPSTELEDVIEV